MKETVKREMVEVLVKTISALVILLMVAGCALYDSEYFFGPPKPDYFYSADEKAPVLIFNSEFTHIILYRVNINPASLNSCQEFKLVRRIIDPFQEVKIQVPADQEVAVSAQFSNYGEYCDPPAKSFTPKKGATYRVTLFALPDDTASHDKTPPGMSLIKPPYGYCGLRIQIDDGHKSPLVQKTNIVEPCKPTKKGSYPQ